MIVETNYKIRGQYKERLEKIRSIVIEEIERREIERKKKVVSFDWHRMKKSEKMILKKDLTDRTCYSCLEPIFFYQKGVTLVERLPEGVGKTYLHLGCVKQKA